MEGYGTSMAQVAEVSVTGSRVRVHKVVVAPISAAWSTPTS